MADPTRAFVVLRGRGGRPPAAESAGGGLPPMFCFVCVFSFCLFPSSLPHSSSKKTCSKAAGQPAAAAATTPTATHPLDVVDDTPFPSSLRAAHKRSAVEKPGFYFTFFSLRRTCACAADTPNPPPKSTTQTKSKQKQGGDENFPRMTDADSKRSVRCGVNSRSSSQTT